MRKLFSSLLFVCAAGISVAQTSMGFSLGGSISDLHKEGQALDKMVFLAASVKKYISPTVNFVSGAGYRFIDATVVNLPQENDLVTFYKDAHPNEFYYITDMEYFRFSYLTIPAGIELKLTTFLRASYLFENNILLGSNASAAEYLQYGKKAVKPYMPTHHVSLMLHTGNAVGISLGVIFRPDILRSDVPYTYGFMDEFKAEFRDSYIVSFSLWGDIHFKNRKKI